MRLPCMKKAMKQNHSGIYTFVMYYEYCKVVSLCDNNNLIKACPYEN